MGWIAFDFDEKVKWTIKSIENILIKDVNNEQVIFWFGDIDTKTVQDFYLDRKIILGEEKKKLIYFVLNSPGGDIDAAYSLIEIIRANCSHFELVVPFWAKSAATLISLAANKILMSPISELGPLDTQIREPGDVHFKGALDEYKAIMQVRQEAFEAFDHFVYLLLQRSGGMRVSELLEPAGKFIANLISPLYNQIDPTIYGKRARQLDVGLEYAKRVLDRYSMLDENSASILAHKLVYEYPSHSFVINFNEAKSLNLPVELIEDDAFDALIRISIVSLLNDCKLIGSLLYDESKDIEENLNEAEAAMTLDDNNNNDFVEEGELDDAEYDGYEN